MDQHAIRTVTTPLDLVGKTPLISLGRLNEKGAAYVYGKLESQNPGGSVKDRICRGMITQAEKDGLLHEKSIIIEPTSGNTGIGLAWIAATRGYRCILTMPESMSPERVKLLKSYGAEVILTPHEGGMGAAILKAEELLKQYGEDAFMPQQFENPANPESHRQTTGPELVAAIEQLKKPIAAFVAGVGTGGTITGTGEVLKAKYPNVKIIAVEPKNSAVLSGGKPGQHQIQGIGAGFIPKVLNTNIIDAIETVTDDDAIETKHQLAKEAGIFVGISAGANACAARRVAKRFTDEELVVTILCDTGERYLSMETF